MKLPAHLKFGELLSFLYTTKTTDVDRIDIVGGLLRKLLRFSHDYCIDAMRELGVKTPGNLVTKELLESGSCHLPDVDTRFRSQKAQETELCNFTTKILSFVSQKMKKISEYFIQNNAFSKFNKVIAGKTSFTIASFGKFKLSKVSQIDSELECIFAKEFEREYLFVHDAFRVNILQLILAKSNTGIKELHALSLECDCLNGWQSFIDILGKVIHVNNPKTVDVAGLPMLVSYISRGYILGDEKVVDDSGSHPELVDVLDTLQGTFFTSTSRYKTVSNQMTNRILRCLHNHHQNDPIAPIIFMYNLILQTRGKVSTEIINKAWKAITEKYHLKEFEEKNSTLPLDIYRAINKHGLPFEVVNAVITLSCFFQLGKIGLEENDPPICLKKHRGKPFIQVRIANSNSPYILIPFKPVEALKILKQFLSITKIEKEKCRVLAKIFNGVIDIKSKRLKSKSLLRAHQIFLEDEYEKLAKEAETLLENKSPLLRYIIYHTLLSLSELPVNTLKLFENFPRTFFNKFCRKRGPQLLENFIRAISLTKYHFVTKLLKNPGKVFSTSLGENYNPKKFLRKWVDLLARTQDENLCALALKIWMQYSNKYSQQTKASFSCSLASSLLPIGVVHAQSLILDIQKNRDAGFSLRSEASSITEVLSSLLTPPPRQSVQQVPDLRPMIQIFDNMLHRCRQVQSPIAIKVVGFEEKAGVFIERLFRSGFVVEGKKFLEMLIELKMIPHSKASTTSLRNLKEKQVLQRTSVLVRKHLDLILESQNCAANDKAVRMLSKLYKNYLTNLQSLEYSITLLDRYLALNSYDKAIFLWRRIVSSKSRKEKFSKIVKQTETLLNALLKDQHNNKNLSRVASIMAHANFPELIPHLKPCWIAFPNQYIEYAVVNEKITHSEIQSIYCMVLDQEFGKSVSHPPLMLLNFLNHLTNFLNGTLDSSTPPSKEILRRVSRDTKSIINVLLYFQKFQEVCHYIVLLDKLHVQTSLDEQTSLRCLKSISKVCTLAQPSLQSIVPYEEGLRALQHSECLEATLPQSEVHRCYRELCSAHILARNYSRALEWAQCLIRGSLMLLRKDITHSADDLENLLKLLEALVLLEVSEKVGSEIEKLEIEVFHFLIETCKPNNFYQAASIVSRKLSHWNSEDTQSNRARDLSESTLLRKVIIAYLTNIADSEDRECQNSVYTMLTHENIDAHLTSKELSYFWGQHLLKLAKIKYPEDNSSNIVQAAHFLILSYEKVRHHRGAADRWANEILDNITSLYLEENTFDIFNEIIFSFFKALSQDNAYYTHEQETPIEPCCTSIYTCKECSEQEVIPKTFSNRFFRYMNLLLTKLLDLDFKTDISHIMINHFVSCNLTRLIKRFPTKHKTLATTVHKYSFWIIPEGNNRFVIHIGYAGNVVAEALSAGIFQSSPEKLVEVMMFLDAKTIFPKGCPLEKQAPILMRLVDRLIKVPNPFGVLRIIQILRGIQSVLVKRPFYDIKTCYDLLIEKIKEYPTFNHDTIYLFEWVRSTLMMNNTFLFVDATQEGFKVADHLCSRLFNVVYTIMVEKKFVPEKENVLVVWLTRFLKDANQFGAFHGKGTNMKYYSLLEKILPLMTKFCDKIDVEFHCNLIDNTFNALCGVEDHRTDIGKIIDRKFCGGFTRKIKEKRALLMAQWLLSLATCYENKYRSTAKELYIKAKEKSIFFRKIAKQELKQLAILFSEK